MSRDSVTNLISRLVDPRRSSIVKHSRLESFLKRNLNRCWTKDSKIGQETVVYYEGCILVNWIDFEIKKPRSTLPFYAFLILTDRRLLWTVMPPKKLMLVVDLQRINDIVSVAGETPSFLLDPYRKVAQLIRIFYTNNGPKFKCRDKNQRNLTSNRNVDHASSNSSSDLSEHGSTSMTSSSSSDSSKKSTNGSPSTISNNQEVIETFVDLILLIPSSEFSHVIYVTWIRCLTRCPHTVVSKQTNFKGDVDGSARYQCLIQIMKSFDKKQTNHCYGQLHELIRLWSSDCPYFTNLLWKDSRILDWLISLMHLTANEDISHESTLKPSKVLSAILDVANREVVSQILDSRYQNIVELLISSTKLKKISSNECCELLFTIFLLPCSVFKMKVVSFLILNDWVVVVGCTSTRIIKIAQQSHISTIDGVSLFKCLFVLRRILQADHSSIVIEYLWKNHSDELRYFASEEQLNIKIYDLATNLKIQIIKILKEITPSVLSFHDKCG